MVATLISFFICRYFSCHIFVTRVYINLNTFLNDHPTVMYKTIFFKKLTEMCRLCICRFIVGCSARHRPDAAHPAATTQREETHPGRRQGRQVLRAPETQQPGGEKIARRPKIAGRRDRDPSELPGERKRYFTSTSCDLERGSKLFATVTAAKTFTTLMGSRGQGHSILVFLTYIHIFSLPFLFKFCYFCVHITCVTMENVVTYEC